MPAHRKDHCTVLGYSFSDIQDMQMKRYKRNHINLREGGDYGADPLGDGTFRMVPSGDIVDYQERNIRLNKLENGE